MVYPFFLNYKDDHLNVEERNSIPLDSWKKRDLWKDQVGNNGSTHS